MTLSTLRTIAIATASATAHAVSSVASTVAPTVVQASKEAYNTITSSVAEEKAVANNRKKTELLASLLEKTAEAHCLPSNVDSVVFTINGVFLKSRREAETHLWGLGLSYDQSSSMLDRLQEDAVAEWHAMFRDVTLEQEYTVLMTVVFAAVFEREDGVKCISGGVEVDSRSYPLDVIDAVMSECLNHPDPANRISSVNEDDTMTLLWPDGRFSRHFYSDQAWWEELD